MRVAHHRLEQAVGVGGVAVGEAALDAGVALVGAAVLVGHHPHDRVVAVALQLGAERAADAAVGAGGVDRPGRHAELDERLSWSATVGQACTQAPHETHSEARKSVPPGEIRESKPRPSMVSANVPWISSQARTHREQTMQAAGS